MSKTGNRSVTLREEIILCICGMHTKTKTRQRRYYFIQNINFEHWFVTCCAISITLRNFFLRNLNLFHTIFLRNLNLFHTICNDSEPQDNRVLNYTVMHTCLLGPIQHRPDLFIPLSVIVSELKTMFDPPRNKINQREKDK